MYRYSRFVGTRYRITPCVFSQNLLVHIGYVDIVITIFLKILSDYFEGGKKERKLGACTQMLQLTPLV